MLSLDQARATVESHVSPFPSDRVGFREALGCFLAADISAPSDFPAFDRSAVDGYAVRGGDERFQIVAEASAGSTAQIILAEGECARVFTGAQVPDGATAVIMQEDVACSGDAISVLRRSDATHIRRRGEDAREGELLLRGGTRLGPAEVALLAQMGILQPFVAPLPRVLHVVTGSELIDPSRSPVDGEIRDSNSTLVAALLACYGSELTQQNRCSDSLENLVSAIESASSPWDVLLISGGASVGDYDFGARALTEVGFEIHFRKVNIRPGKPLVFATRGQQVAFVIPGNPVAHLVTFHLIIRHALDRLQGSDAPLPLISVTVERDVPPAPDARETWWPARVGVQAGGFSAKPLPWRSSGDLCGVVSTNALLRVPTGSPHPAGTSLECLLLDHRF